MAKANVSLRLDSTRISRLVGEVSTTMLRKASTVTTQRARANLSALGRNHTGRLAASIRTRSERGAGGLVHSVIIYSDSPYAIFQEKGTRAHGPVRAKFLRFQIRGQGPVIYAKWVRGVRPGRFMERALRALRASDFH